MINMILELMEKLSRGKIQKEEFLTELNLKTGLIFSEELCIERFKRALDMNEPNEIGVFIKLSFIVSLTQRSVPVLCRLLLSDVHYNHEDLARLIMELRSIDAIECLYKATEMEFDYLNYDNTYQFARKCIKALSAIDDTEATDKLRRLAGSKISVIADYARKEITRKHV